MDFNGTNLTQFYDNIKQKLNNDEVNDNIVNVKLNHGGFNNSPGALAWRNSAVKCRNKLEDDCYKHILLDIYCKILPLDNNFIDGHQGMIKQDINNMLNSKGMSATQYMKSCYEATKAPLLEFVIRSVNNIGKYYMEEAEETLKDAQENDEPIEEPKELTTDDKEIENQLIDITNDTEYDNFVDTLKKKTIDKIVSDVSRIINDEKEKENMTFDTTPIENNEEKFESTTSIALDYMQKELIKENTEIDDNINEEIIGMAIRESVINQFDVVFKQPSGLFNEFSSRIHFGKGVVVNKEALNNFK